MNRGKQRRIAARMRSYNGIHTPFTVSTMARYYRVRTRTILRIGERAGLFGVRQMAHPRWHRMSDVWGFDDSRGYQIVSELAP